MEQTKNFNFLEDAKNLDEKNYSDYDFKRDYVLSFRLSYGEEKQKEQIFKDYVRFLRDNLKIINEKNETIVKTKKASSYYFAFEKTQDFNLYFEQLQKFIETLEENNKQKQVLTSLLNCKNDIEQVNFTIANFEEKKDKILNFINFCKNKKLVK